MDPIRRSDRVVRMKISDSLLRALVREVLEGHPGGDVWEPSDDSTKVSAVVDPQEDDTCPVNPDYTPQDKVELGVALRNLVKNLPDEKMPDIYKHVKDAMALDKEKTEKDAEMKDKTIKRNKVEEAIRREIRRHLMEMGPGAAYRGMDYYGEMDPEDDDPDRRRYATMSDVDGAGFKEIAAELGLSVAGAKQLVDKTLSRAKFVGTMDQDELEVMTLVAIKDYINHLQSTGELSPADVQLMMDHPDIVRELDGFREFLHRYVRRARKQYAKAGRLDPTGRVTGHGLEIGEE